MLIRCRKKDVKLAEFSIEVSAEKALSEKDMPTLENLRIKIGNELSEINNRIDFNQDYSEDNIANRRIEPIFDDNQNVIKYKITKVEKVNILSLPTTEEELLEEGILMEQELDVKKFIECVLYLNKMEISVKNYTLDTSGAKEKPQKDDFIKLSDEDYRIFCYNLNRFDALRLIVNRHDSNYSCPGHDPLSFLKNLLLNRILVPPNNTEFKLPQKPKIVNFKYLAPNEDD